MAMRVGKGRKRISVSDEEMQRYVDAFPDVFNPERTQALFMIRALAQRIDDDYNALLEQFGVTAPKVSYLAALFASPHGLSLSDLSERVRTSNANVTIMMNALERDGLVRRKRHPTDGRATLAALTPKGMLLIRRVFPEHLENGREALKDMSMSDVRALIKLLGRVGGGFDALMLARGADDQLESEAG